MVANYPETMIIYCPATVATVLNIWCSVGCLLTTPTILFSMLRSYDPETIMIYSPTAVATICCSLTTPTTPSISLPTCYWYCVYI